jgi:hypothetical protein
MLINIRLRPAEHKRRDLLNKLFVYLKKWKVSKHRRMFMTFPATRHRDFGNNFGLVIWVDSSLSLVCRGVSGVVIAASTMFETV